MKLQCIAIFKNAFRHYALAHSWMSSSLKRTVNAIKFNVPSLLGSISYDKRLGCNCMHLKLPQTTTNNLYLYSLRNHQFNYYSCGFVVATHIILCWHKNIFSLWKWWKESQLHNKQIRSNCFTAGSIFLRGVQRLLKQQILIGWGCIFGPRYVFAY